MHHSDSEHVRIGTHTRTHTHASCESSVDKIASQEAVCVPTVGLIQCTGIQSATNPEVFFLDCTTIVEKNDVREPQHFEVLETANYFQTSLLKTFSVFTLSPFLLLQSVYSPFSQSENLQVFLVFFVVSCFSLHLAGNSISSHSPKEIQIAMV